MAVIKSGYSKNELIVNPTSNAARVSLYDITNNIISTKSTYRACHNGAGGSPTPGSTAPFLSIYGSSTKLVKVAKIKINASASPDFSVVINLSRYSSIHTGGTIVTLTKVPMDSNSRAFSSTKVLLYTAAPTAGVLVSVIETRRMLANGAPDHNIIFDLRDPSSLLHKMSILKNESEGLSLSYATAPGGAQAGLRATIEWTEE